MTFELDTARNFTEFAAALKKFCPSIPERSSAFLKVMTAMNWTRAAHLFKMTSRKIWTWPVRFLKIKTCEQRDRSERTLKTARQKI